MPYALHFEILLCICKSYIALADASKHSGGCRRRQLCVSFASTRNIGNSKHTQTCCVTQPSSAIRSSIGVELCAECCIDPGFCLYVLVLPNCTHIVHSAGVIVIYFI